MPGLFADDAAIRRVAGERVLLLGGGRALLMQIAHPLVAAGVADHSDFAEHPLKRLARTLEATNTIVYGSEEDARRTAAAVGAVHERVTGAGYHASDPDLVLWVHATLVDTIFRIHRRFLRPLPPSVAEEFYEQSKVVAELFGCPVDHQPATLGGFRDYVRDMVASIEVGDTSRMLAHAIFTAPLPFPLGLTLPAVRELSIGLLPDPLRRQLGFAWDPARELALQTLQTTARQVLPLLPPFLRQGSLPGLGRPRRAA